MVLEDCPLPELLQGLESYIKPRGEVAQLRARLQDEVSSQLRRDGEAASTNLIDARPGLRSPSVGTITGVRQAYLKAHQAHAAAQSRYEALKADLNRLAASAESHTDGTSASKSATESYIPLLRHRERQRKLKVIERTFSHIKEIGKATVDGHLDDIVKHRAGDLPAPPTTQAPSFGEKPDVESRILELKKAVLASKQAIDGQTMTTDGNANADGSAGAGPDADIASLQAALNELTGWMEHQLAIIGDAEAENQRDAPSTPGQKKGHTQVATIEDIEGLYDDYVAARQHLVQTIANPQVVSTLRSLPEPMSPSSDKDGLHCATAAETLLPYLDRLRMAKQTEESLRRQSTHLRRQIASSEAETLSLISRLADESHMVQPGASKGRDWSQAAREADQATIKHVQQKVISARTAVNTAEEMLEGTGSIPSKFDVLSSGKHQP